MFMKQFRLGYRKRRLSMGLEYSPNTRQILREQDDMMQSSAGENELNV